jgi:RNA polymerase sigma-70 factor (ECF subfamily)
MRRGRSVTRGDRHLAGLMGMAQDGDEGAYRHVLRACVKLAAAAARQQGVPPGMVDEVVRDVLISLHRARGTYDATRPFEPWLRAIAIRRAIDALRRHRRGGRALAMSFWRLCLAWRKLQRKQDAASPRGGMGGDESR